MSYFCLLPLFIVKLSLICLIVLPLLLIALQFLLFPLWPLILSTYDFYVPFLSIYNFVLMSCTFGFLNFHVSYLNYEKFNLCLQNTLNMSKTTRVYFGVLQALCRKRPMS